ncbi:Sialoadhesin [Labeo rohita]|uniref:Sialoadhesin n=1 Tax=Labeo rohita TaxID=84645 RepID=A0ABQ8L6G8_LABRO|nr:Sialoadhesin [Labeo rohita]
MCHLKQAVETATNIRELETQQHIMKSSSVSFIVCVNLHKVKIMNSRLSALILLLLIQGSVTFDRLSVTCSQKSICAVKGSEVTLKCSYSNINIKTVFWFSEKQSTNWRKNNEPEDLTLDSDYSGRVKHQISSSSSTLTISDVRERDSGEYQLMFIMNDGVKHLSSAAVNLTVTDPASPESSTALLITVIILSVLLIITLIGVLWYRSISSVSFIVCEFTQSEDHELQTLSADPAAAHSSEKQNTNWRKNNEPEDLTLDSDYSGRVKHQISSSSSTLTISDVRERDSGEYQLMFIMNDGVKHLSSAAVSLTVTDLQVKMNPVSTDPTDKRTKLTCDTSCTSGVWYYWMKDGQHFTYTQSPTYLYHTVEMLAAFPVLFIQTIDILPLLCSVCWDVTYTSTRVCALVNSTVDISCTYSHPSDHTVNKTFWHYGPSWDFKDLREEHQFAGRVEYVGNKLRIKDLKISDSGEYQFRIITDLDQYSGSPGVILTVTGTQINSSTSVVSEKDKVILSCSTNCTLKDKHTYIWYKNGRQVTDGFTKVNKLYLDSVSNEELQQYSCAVGDPVNSTVFSHYTVTLLLFLPQFLIIAALWMW